MQSSSRAPVLSATLRRVSCWIIALYLAFSTISARRQRFVFESGRVSTMRTVSPTPAVLASSCAGDLTAPRVAFLYFGGPLVTATLANLLFWPLPETAPPPGPPPGPRSAP